MSARIRTAAKRGWKAFPYPDAAYDRPGGKLAQHWDRLHRGDCEPYPDAASVRRLVARHPELRPPGTVDDAAERLAEAWRAYHAGAFGHAVEVGLGLGPLGYNVANKAAIIHATYLDDDEDKKRARLIESAKRAEALCGCAETMANAWYFRAQALGRYGQSISVARALAEGLGGQVKSALEQALALQPRHADAHIAFGTGTYNAEVIGKMGELMGRLTYGVSKDAALRHFASALKLNPGSAIARIEYANGLVMLFGKTKLAQATALYREAAGCEAADAMERLDVELAKSELSD